MLKKAWQAIDSFTDKNSGRLTVAFAACTVLTLLGMRFGTQRHETVHVESLSYKVIREQQKVGGGLSFSSGPYGDVTNVTINGRMRNGHKINWPVSKEDAELINPGEERRLLVWGLGPDNTRVISANPAP